MNKTLILSLIVLSQFFGTSLWFSSNAVLPSIAEAHHLTNSDLLANLTIATQIGFILGSLCYAIFNLADRYKANIVFSISILLAAASNAAITLPHLNFELVFLFRFLTGFFLAGVYPVGMKIAAHFFPKTVSKALGVLVGALVLGTAFPHFIASFKINLPWDIVILTSSILAVVGGILLFFLDTPSKNNIQKLDFSILPKLFTKRDFNKASIGYFGHMWELYTFWTFVPLLISTYTQENELDINNSLLSFIVIGVGAFGCVLAGKVANRKGSLSVAQWALYGSLFCCLLCPFSFYLSPIFFYIFLIIWGITVVADSPLLSTLINNRCLQNYNGTALTLSTSIGFIFTIISISFFNYLLQFISIPFVFLLLAIGPLASILALRKN
ncbi:MFS transporter [Wenyingzhuangia sp. 1_MG-2023]|nr:MFS transporter [Wenyingzhuangia sp. 1_MG-2023]